MAIVSLPYTLTAGTPENVNNLNSNLTAIVAGVNQVDTAQLSAGSVTYAKLASDITDLIAPVGAMLDYGGSSDPVAGKWVLADGRALSRSTYATLFGLLSTTYGVGDGTTTFNIPDLRGRASVGPDNMGTAQGAASRMSDNNTRGASAGSSSVTLTTAQLPAHGHAYSNSISGSVTTNPGFNTGYDAWNNGGSSGAQWQVGESGFYFYVGSTYAGQTNTQFTYKPHTHSIPSLTGTFSGTSSGTTSNTGSGTAVDLRQPYQVVNKIIRIA